MFLKSIFISNFKSIDKLSVNFTGGKNVIVGKNNSGKSNIVKAINLILGENSPSYAKSENITLNDFYKGNTDEPIHIFCELHRAPDESLNYREINKCFGFYKANERYHIDVSSVSDTIENFKVILNLNKDGISSYVNPKLKNQQTFENEFEDKFSFAYLFSASISENGMVQKELRFFYRESQHADWVVCFSAPIRNELLQSAIINSFRDPQNELRINQWSWFGKLMKSYIDPNNKKLQSAFSVLKDASNEVFRGLQEEINNSKIQVAFPQTTISFQFNADTKIDVYKSTLIYVNDGFNSLLQEKGSGIQSAVIIGLFNYYTKNIAHLSSSLLVVEEPELYLHPQARRVISNRIDEFLDDSNNQVIITTHSSEFINSAHEKLNIISITKDSDFGTTARNVIFENSKEKQILVKSQNSEMFFADKVILVEGGEKYILEAAAKYYGKNIRPELGEHWINERNISVISVGGKSEFAKYANKLNELKITYYILADFDFLLRGLSEFFTIIKMAQKGIDALNSLKSQLELNTFKLPASIENYVDEFISKVEDEHLKVDRKALRKYIKLPFTAKKICDFEDDKQQLITEFMRRLHKINLFILKGELENYYTDECRMSLPPNLGKEETPIYIVSEMLSEDKNICDLINTEEYFNLFNKVIQ